jgi:transcriptional regulator with XRE-family HTH domain
MTTYRLRSDRLREAAEAKGDSTSYAVHKRTGIAESTLSRLHSGKTKPSIDSLLTLANTYGIDVDELIEREEQAAEPAKESA